MPRESRLAAVSWFIVLVVASTAFAESAARGRFETYEQAKNRSIGRFSGYSLLGPSAEAAKVEWLDLDTSALPVVKSPAKLFSLIRDSRYLLDSAHPAFLRRSSWLYPQDGCWIRAALARKLAEKNGFGDLKKIFIFGTLQVSTKNAPGGVVSWWYHVVPAFADTSGKAMVIDPAIDPAGPLELETWVKTMVPDVKDARYSVCTPGTYSPSDACESIDDFSGRYADSDQSYYLRLEWSNLEMLKRDPAEELADHPPWLTPFAALSSRVP